MSELIHVHPRSDLNSVIDLSRKDKILTLLGLEKKKI